MEAADHTWVLEVLRDILKYAEKFDLVALRENCRMAYESALSEIGRTPSQTKRVARQQGFIDSIRELIDYAERENLEKTKLYLLQALVSASSSWDHPQLAGIVIPFPPLAER